MPQATTPETRTDEPTMAVASSDGGEPVSLPPALFERLLNLLDRAAPPPVAGVDADGYGIVPQPRESNEAEDAAWRTPDGKVYDHWYSPEFTDATLRVTHNVHLQISAGAFTPINQKQDDFMREWVRKQRGGNDPERWHGDTPGLVEDLECEFCHRFTARNQLVMRDHKTKRHNREDMGDMPWRPLAPNLIRAGRVSARH